MMVLMTQTQGFRRWNDELLAGLNQATGNRWIELLRRLDEQSNAMQDGVKEELEKLGRRMRSIQHLAPIDPRTKLMLNREPSSPSTTELAQTQETRAHLPVTRRTIPSKSIFQVRSHPSIPMRFI